MNMREELEMVKAENETLKRHLSDALKISIELAEALSRVIKNCGATQNLLEE